VSAQVAEVVRIARANNLPIVPRGAGTGLSGGSVAQSGGVVIALTRMAKILEVDYDNRIALVEPGVINLELSDWVKPGGYFFAPDPSSQRACTIGGNVAENSGGPHCLKYGVTHHILGLEVVDPEGKVRWIGGKGEEHAGYDLTGVFVGSEGMLGVVTKALVRLTAKPETISVQLAAFPTVESASLAVSRIIGAGILPAALEMMDNLTIQAVEPAYHAGYPMEAGAVLLIETDGVTEDVHDGAYEIERICKEAGAFLVRQAITEKERDLLEGPQEGDAAMGRLAPVTTCIHVVPPKSSSALTQVRRSRRNSICRLPCLPPETATCTSDALRSMTSAISKWWFAAARR